MNANCYWTYWAGSKELSWLMTVCHCNGVALSSGPASVGRLDLHGSTLPPTLLFRDARRPSKWRLRWKSHPCARFLTSDIRHAITYPFHKSSSAFRLAGSWADGTDFFKQCLHKWTKILEQFAEDAHLEGRSPWIFFTGLSCQLSFL